MGEEREVIGEEDDGAAEVVVVVVVVEEAENGLQTRHLVLLVARF